MTENWVTICLISYPDLPRPEYDRVRSGYKIIIWKDPPHSKRAQAPMEFRCDLVKVSWKEVCWPQRYVRSAVSAMTHCSGRLLQPARKAWTAVTFKSREIVRGLMKAQSIKWRVSVGFERLRFAWRRICNLPLDLRNLSVNICKACQARSDSVL